MHRQRGPGRHFVKSLSGQSLGTIEVVRDTLAALVEISSPHQDFVNPGKAAPPHTLNTA